MLETIYLALVQDKKSRAFYRQMHAVQFMSTAPLFYYEIHLKYCQDMDAYG